LITANTTRWNSQLKSIRSILKSPDNVNKAVTKLGQLEQRRMGGGFNQTEINALTELVTILEPFEEATDLTQGDKVVTVSSIVPAIVGLRTSLCLDESATTSSLRYAEPLHKKLKDACAARLEQFLTRDNKIAAVLDPNFRKTWLGREEDSLVEEEILRMLHAEVVELSSESENDGSTPPASPSNAPSQKKLFSFMQTQSSDESLRTSQNQMKSKVQKQLERFLKENPSKAESPLLYWKRMEIENAECKLLAKVAREFFGLTATSAPSERLFSVAGNIHRERRGHMGNVLLKQLTFLAANSDMF